MKQFNARINMFYGVVYNASACICTEKDFRIFFFFVNLILGFPFLATNNKLKNKTKQKKNPTPKQNQNEKQKPTFW